MFNATRGLTKTIECDLVFFWENITFCHCDTKTELNVSLYRVVVEDSLLLVYMEPPRLPPFEGVGPLL